MPAALKKMASGQAAIETNAFPIPRLRALEGEDSKAENANDVGIIGIKYQKLRVRSFIGAKNA